LNTVAPLDDAARCRVVPLSSVRLSIMVLPVRLLFREVAEILVLKSKALTTSGEHPSSSGSPNPQRARKYSFTSSS